MVRFDHLKDCIKFGELVVVLEVDQKTQIYEPSLRSESFDADLGFWYLYLILYLRDVIR